VSLGETTQVSPLQQPVQVLPQLIATVEGPVGRVVALAAMR
jgi:hypothetical protein